MRLWGIVAAAFLAVTLAGLPATAAEKAGSYHKNEAWGFKLRTPAKWNVIHMSTKEQWIALKAIGPRDLYGPKGEGWGMRPEMWVVAFPHERVGRRGAKPEKIGENTTLITIENPYKNYKDFVKREKRLAMGSAGFYFSVEEEQERDGYQVDIFEIKAEKMTDTPFRVMCWVWHTEYVDYAVHFKIPDNHFDDYKSTFETCAKSFKEIARTQPMPGQADTTGRNIIDVDREEDMTPEQKRRKRVEDVERFILDEIGNLPKDWTCAQGKNFCVISHADKKFTKRILDHAENIRKYLEKMFPDLGSDHVPRGIIRIFKDNAEEQAFREGTRSIWFDDQEQIMISADRGFGQLWEFETVSRNVTRLWLYYKNRNLWNSMPWWLQRGLEGHMEKARPSKSKKLVFAPDTGDVLSLVRMVRSGKAVPIKGIFLGTAKKKHDEEKEKQDPNATPSFDPSGFMTGQEFYIQTESIFHYMMTKGNKGKFKGSVVKYMTTLITAIEEEDKKFEAEEERLRKKRLEEWKKKVEANGGEPPEESEEDEEKELEEQQERWKDYSRRLEEKRLAIAKKCFDAAFGHIDDKGWTRLDKSWAKWAEKGGK